MTERNSQRYKLIKFYMADFQGNVLFSRKKTFRRRSLFLVRLHRRLSSRIRSLLNPADLRKKPLTLSSSSILMKQRLKRYYSHFKEYQFRNLYRKAKSRFVATKLLSLKWHFFRLVEMRLDAILLRSNFFSMNSIRQLICHKFIMVNNKVCHSLGVEVTPGDIVTFRDHFLVDRFWFRLKKAKFVGRRLLKKLTFRFSFSFGSYIACSHILIDLKRRKLLIMDFPTSIDELYFPFEMDVEKFLVLYQFLH